VIGGDFNTGDFLWLSHVFPLPGFQKQRSMVRAEMKQHGFSTPFEKYVRTLRALPLQLDWIYVRALEAIDSGVTRIGFSDHNAIWTTLQPGEATASRR
jgi:endonuclease/exonuclease/phosphatase (EEP) superfamily protein YafD